MLAESEKIRKPALHFTAGPTLEPTMKTLVLALILLIASVLPMGNQASAQSISPNVFDFGNVNLGNTSPIQVFTFNNTSPDPATLSGVLIGGANPDQYQIAASTCTVGLVVASAASCTVSVRFEPSAAGNQVALVRIQFNQPPPNPPGGAENTATLFGQGVVPTPALPVPGLGPLGLAIAVLALFGAGLAQARRRYRPASRGR